MAMGTQRCLYEILGVQSTASNEEVRSAYRKLALRCHPDKIQQTGASAEACQEATLQFQEIGRAYEVLSDPSERSWYDSHRTRILSSSSFSSAPFSSEFDFNPWPFFSPSAFVGKGFFAVYRDLFTQLHHQETGFACAHGLRPPCDPPDMGNLSTPFPQVQKFYNHWLGFSTVKDFAWCDGFRASAGANRKQRRLMEEENKKIRSKARKAFNEAIRRLAAFVRKRDKRVRERQLEVQRLEKEKEEIRKARRERDEEEKMMKARLYEEAEWTKVEEVRISDDGSDVDGSIGGYAWGPARPESKKNQQAECYCIVCSKKFKSDEQWRNHEKSKKHLEKVAALKESFEEDHKQFARISQMNMRDNSMIAEREQVLEGLPDKNLSENEVCGIEMTTSQSSAANEGDGDVSSEGIVDADQEDGLGSNSSLILEEDKDDLCESSKKKKSKGRLRSEKLQAAYLSRHSKLVEELTSTHVDVLMHNRAASAAVDDRDSEGLEQEEDCDVLRPGKNKMKVEKLERKLALHKSSSKGNVLINTHSQFEPDQDQAGNPGRGRNCKLARGSCCKPQMVLIQCM